MFWVASPWPIYLSAGVGLIAFYGWRLSFEEDIPGEIWLKLLDGLGLAFFAINGVQRSLEHGTPAGVAVLLGICSGVFGGVIRDTLSNQIPFVFRSEVYATAALAGGLVYVILPPDTWGRFELAFACAFGLRLGGIFFQWRPPSPSF